jgi:hypothetical protein
MNGLFPPCLMLMFKQEIEEAKEKGQYPPIGVLYGLLFSLYHYEMNCRKPFVLDLIR